MLHSYSTGERTVQRTTLTFMPVVSRRDWRSWSSRNEQLLLTDQDKQHLTGRLQAHLFQPQPTGVRPPMWRHHSYNTHTLTPALLHWESNSEASCHWGLHGPSSLSFRAEMWSCVSLSSFQSIAELWLLLIFIDYCWLFVISVVQLSSVLVLSLFSLTKKIFKHENWIQINLYDFLSSFLSPDDDFFLNPSVIWTRAWWVSSVGAMLMDDEGGFLNQPDAFIRSHFGSYLHVTNISQSRPSEWNLTCTRLCTPDHLTHPLPKQLLPNTTLIYRFTSNHSEPQLQLKHHPSPLHSILTVWTSHILIYECLQKEPTHRHLHHLHHHPHHHRLTDRMIILMWSEVNNLKAWISAWARGYSWLLGLL